MAYRVVTIAGNTFSHIILGKLTKSPFSGRMKASIESELSPFSVYVLGAMAGEAVWAIFVSTICPFNVTGIVKEAVKVVVTAPSKQMGRAASQYGYNRLFGGNTKTPKDYFSLKDAIKDLTGSCAATTTVNRVCSSFKCGGATKFFAYMVGFDLGYRFGNATYKFGRLVIFGVEHSEEYQKLIDEIMFQSYVNRLK